jgi:hypothetical protein
MTISELVEELNKVSASYGDIPVTMYMGRGRFDLVDSTMLDRINLEPEAGILTTVVVLQ